jgi:hypothetical protein
MKKIIALIKQYRSLDDYTKLRVEITIITIVSLIWILYIQNR